MWTNLRKPLLGKPRQEMSLISSRKGRQVDVSRVWVMGGNIISVKGRRVTISGLWPYNAQLCCCRMRAPYMIGHSRVLIKFYFQPRCLEKSGQGALVCWAGQSECSDRDGQGLLWWDSFTWSGHWDLEKWEIVMAWAAHRKPKDRWS